MRRFSEMMPAFRGALTPEQLQRVMDYIRTMCTDDAWPRGELNLPRPLFTEKAYPEDEWVVAASLPVDGSGQGARSSSTSSGWPGPDGEIVFESGAVAADGSIAGDDHDQDGAAYEPHHAEIRSPDQVQVYQSVMTAPGG